jgi:hypothetical protein
MRNILTALLIAFSITSFGQITGKTVTTINLKMESLNTTFLKFKETEWKMIQKGADGSITEIRGFNVINADNNSISFEQKDFGINLKIDFSTKKVTALENGKPSAQNILYISANNKPVILEQPDIVDIYNTVDGTNVTSIKWKNELMNDIHTLHLIKDEEWSCSYEAINMKASFPKWTKKFKEVAYDKNSIILEEINEDPSNTIFYATKFKIDIAAKIVYKAVYEADVKKWTPLEKDENGNNVFLIIK